jgi:hypothetical protein
MPVAPTRPTPGPGYSGPVPSEVWEILGVSWEHPIAVQSDYARANAPFIALAASLGWISNVRPDCMSFGRHWLVTAVGIHALRTATSL